MSYKEEFDEKKYSIPRFITEENGWTDESWHNDVCPRFVNNKLKLGLWVYPNDPKRRDGDKRLSLHLYDEDTDLSYNLLDTDRASHLALYLRNFHMHYYDLAYAFAQYVRDWLTEKQLETVVKRNSTEEYSEACATHDFIDSNQAMIEAYKCIYKREPCMLLKEDVNLINKSWAIARGLNFDFSIYDKERNDTKVVIVIRKGALEAVYANKSINYVLVDYDNRENGGEAVELGVQTPDKVQPNLHELLKGKEGKALKELNF